MAQFGQMRVLLENKLDDPRSSLVTDLDQDGDLDIILSTFSPAGIVWYEHRDDHTFSDPVTLIPESYVTDLALGDIDGDGDEDLVGSRYGPDRLMWWPRNDAAFGAMQTIDTSIDQPSHLLVADLDVDGDQDLVVTGGDQTLSLFEGLGGGEFGPRQVLNSGLWHLRPAVAGDIDGDGSLDLVVATPYGNNITWHRNTGDLSFLPAVTINAQVDSLACIEIADMNGDGALDLIFPAPATDQVVWQQNNGNGTFGAVHVIAWGINNAISIQVYDVDMDGDMDVACTSAPDDQVHLLINNGNGSYTEQLLNDAVYGFDLSVIDMDDDGGLDLFYVTGGNDLVWHKNLGSGAFSSQTQITRQVREPRWLTSGDLDGDGDNDMISASFDDQRIAWYENIGAGEFKEQRNLFLGGGGYTFVTTADVDGDGILDLLTSQPPNIISIHKGIGNAQFEIPVVINSTVTYYTELICADLDADGDLDLIANATSSLTYFLNNGDGTFAAGTTFTGSISGDIFFAVADMDGDSLLDVVHSTSGYSRIAWYRNNGGGAFAPQATIAQNVYDIDRIACADLNGDGHMDVIAGTPPLRWFAGDGNGTFGSHTTFGQDNSNYTTHGLLAFDADGDGDNDVIVSRGDYFDPGYIGLYRNNGDGTFQPRQILANGIAGYGIPLTTGNIHGNGSRELLGGNTGRLFWFSNYFNSKYRILGKRFHDVDGNGSYDAGEPPLSWGQALVTPNLSSALSGADGGYIFYLDTGTFYITSSAGNAYWTLSTQPATYTVQLTEDVPQSSGNDFGFTALVDTSLIVPSITVADAPCGGTTSMWISFSNQGTRIESGTMTVELDEDYTYVSSDPIPSSIQGNSIIWAFDSLGYFEVGNIHLVIDLPTVDLMGTELITTATVNTIWNGSPSGEFPTTFATVLACPYDPNDKQVEPAGYGQFGALAMDTEHLDYTIRFQNTGTAQAFNVMLRDALPDQVDLAQLMILGYSHQPSHVALEPGHELVVKFDNIMLPPSYINEENSQGFIKFRLPLQPGLPHLTQFQNTAEIFFDVNPPIITNMTTSTLVDCDQWQPVVEEVGVELLQASPGDAYQWLLAGVQIEGATSFQLQAPETGEYSCEVTSVHGCTAVTSPLFVLVTAISELASAEFSVHPNPFNESFVVRSQRPLTADHEVILFDLQGRKLRSMWGIGSDLLSVPRNGLSPGLYLLRMYERGVPVGDMRIVAE